MPEKHWKQRYFWWCEAITIIACAIVFLSLGEWAGSRSARKSLAKPVKVHVIVHYQPVETTQLTQWVGEVAVEAVRQSRRSEPGKLSPETLRAVELQAAKEIFQDGRDPFEKRWK